MVNIETLRDEFQYRLGALPLVNVLKMELLCETREVLVVEPSSLSEIARIVRTARSMKLRIRCCGNGSGSNKALLPDANNIMLRSSNLCDQEKIQFVAIRKPASAQDLVDDADATEGHHPISNDRYVRILAGTSVQELCDFQVANMISVKCNTENPACTVIGSIITACTNCGSMKRSLLDELIEIRFIDSNGILQNYCANGEPVEEERLRQSVSNLGLLGVIYDVTLKVHAMKLVVAKTTLVKLKEAEDGDILESALRDSVFSQVFLFPYNNFYGYPNNWNLDEEVVLIRKLTKFKGGISSLRRWVSIVEDGETGDSVIQQDNNIGDRMRRLIERQRLAAIRRHTQNLPWEIHCLNAGGVKFVHFDMSFEVDSDNVSSVFVVLRGVLELCKSYAAEHQAYPLNGVVKVDFSKSSAVLLSSAARRSGALLAHVSLRAVKGTPLWNEFCRDFAQLVWRVEPAAVPSWVCDWTAVPDVETRLRGVFDGDIAVFRQLIDKTDRDGMFMNDRLAGLFCPESAGGDEFRSRYQRKEGDPDRE